MTDSEHFKGLKGKINLIFTSPPFPLNKKKAYGNLTGEKYRDWLSGFASVFREMLAPDGSLVIELGNAWIKGSPVMSTLALESLMALQKAGNFFLCQEFIWHNTTRLPTPAQWVNIERIRVKDSFTRLWWLSTTTRPKADNRRVLKEYSPAMKRLLNRGNYNAGKRPSEHKISEKGFLLDNGGAIPGNVLPIPNTVSSDPYLNYCRQNNLKHHPARMPPELANFFISFLTEPGDIVLDPFAGSNITGYSAELLDRHWVGVELNEVYARVSMARFPEGKLIEE